MSAYKKESAYIRKLALWQKRKAAGDKKLLILMSEISDGILFLLLKKHEPNQLPRKVDVRSPARV